MLTAKENMIEVINGGTPERFVNQYEAVQILFHPYLMEPTSMLAKGDSHVVNAWGISYSYPEGTPGQFPDHAPEYIVIKDIENWRDYVKAPSLEYSDEQWAICKAMFDAVDGTQAFKAPLIASGLFEQTHNLCEITNALMYFITNPKEMHELIEYLTEWELELAEKICTHLKPDALLHHDDWGSGNSTFLSLDMFTEFFLEPYTRIYGYYKEHGVDLIIHHSDSYAATLVPRMIEMGIDVWQGCTESNNIPELIEHYGGQITFMGGLDNKFVDFEGWTKENNREVVKKVCDECGTKYFIPCILQGGPGSVYPGVYESLAEEIDKYSEEVFGISEDAISRIRPMQVMF